MPFLARAQVHRFADDGTFPNSRSPVLVRPRCRVEFRVVGADPAGTSADMNYGEKGERPGTDRNIARVAFPGGDPVGGSRGELMVLWGKFR